MEGGGGAFDAPLVQGRPKKPSLNRIKLVQINASTKLEITSFQVKREMQAATNGGNPTMTDLLTPILTAWELGRCSKTLYHLLQFAAKARTKCLALQKPKLP